MKFRYDPQRPGYRNPKDKNEKLFILIALLHEPRKRYKDALAEFLEKSERQLLRDLKEIAQHFPVEYDEAGRPYIAE